MRGNVTVVIWGFLLTVCGLCVTGQKNYKCDFERNLCPFLTNDVNNRVKWQIGQGKVNAKTTGPSVDHTYGNSTGKYLFVDVSQARTSSIRLWGPAMSEDYCISFWYHMFGADIGSLWVTVIYGTYNTQAKYFERHGSQGDRWKEARFSVKYDSKVMGKNYKISFTVQHQKFFYLNGDIAIDDVEFGRKKCPDTPRPDRLCTFDDGSCGFTSTIKSNSLSWLIDRSNVDPDRDWSVPLVDHTLFTDKGGFWFAHTLTTKENLETAVLTSPSYKATKNGSQCLHFYYFMYANYASFLWGGKVNDAYLKVYLNYNSKNPIGPIWTKFKNNTRHVVWSYAEAKVDTSATFKIDFVATMSTTVSATIAVDDVKLINGQCPEAGFCNFEDDKCTWTDGDADIVWLRKNGASSTNNEKGPLRDKTTDSNKGYYVFINIEDKQPNLKAVLESEPFLPTKKPACVVFWYYMYGNSDLGTLKVRRKLQNVTEATLWQLSGHQFDGWKLGHAPAAPSLLSTQYVFEGVTGKGETGFMALDDIIVRSGENCSIKPDYAAPSYETIRLITCSFDDFHFCNWRQENDTLPWQFGNTSQIGNTGPKQPVNGKGHFIFISSYNNWNRSGETARLISPAITSNYPDSFCFSFYYYMFGAHVSELRVILVPMKDDSTSLGQKIIWRRRGTQVDKWIQFKDSLKLDEGEYELYIEADGGSGFAGDIAVDEVTIGVGECMNSGLCDFESSLCGWKIEQSKSNSFYWMRQSYNPKISTKGPQTDHTTLSGDGNFLQAVANKNVKNEETNFVSPEYAKNLGKHCLTFWYYRPGYGTGKLSVATRVNKKEDLQWSAAYDVGKLWHYGQANIDVQQQFQIVIKAEVGTKTNYEMAIDDIFVKNFKCPPPASCNFNSDYCSYFQNTSSNFAWLLGTGRVVNMQLIEPPPIEDKKETEMFVYADMTSPYLKENETAILVSDILHPPTTLHSCVTFDYHISGKNVPFFSVGTMNLDNTEQDMKYIIKNVWRINQVTGPGWVTKSLPIEGLKKDDDTRDFQLYFKVQRGDGPSGLVAFDNVVYNDGVCATPTTTTAPIVTEMPPSVLSCDFDSNTFCSWVADNSKVRWQISTPKNTKGNMPKYDHTKQNYNGRYAYMMGDELSVKNSNLQSKPFPKGWETVCFSFWYVMNVESKSSNRLRIQVARLTQRMTPQISSDYWSRQGNFGNRWRHAYVNINALSRTYSYTRLNIIGHVQRGVIAVDDLAAVNGTCPPTKLCTFEGETRMCGYTQDAQNTVYWKVKSGDDNDVIFKMPDHTTKSTVGKYLYIGFNTTSKPEKSRIYTQQIPPTDSSCVTFYYHIYNTSNLALNTYLVTDNGISDPLWSASMSQGLLWHGARFTAVSRVLQWEIVFEVVTAKNGSGQVALDDISIEKGKCPDPGYCDFEKENCMWENVIPPEVDTDTKGISDIFKDDFDWVRHIGEDYFGPSVDNTLKSPEGFYLLLDTRFAKGGEKAVYISERLQASVGACFTFWYSIPNKSNSGILRIYSSSDFKQTKLVKAFQDSTSGDWKKASVSIIPEAVTDRPLNDFWILIAGYAGDNSLAYIALDDLSVSYGLCDEQSELFDCKNGEHVKAVDVCNFRKDCMNGLDEENCADCDFESGSCGWKSQDLYYSEFRWVRSRAGIDGLEFDHTKQDASGFFMIAAMSRATWSTYNALANLKSTVLRDAFSPCTMEFWYNVRGKPELSVQLRRHNISTEVWFLDNRSPYVWTRTDVVLSRIARTFEIVLFAKKDKEICHIAIDDISMLDCETPANLGEMYCKQEEFNCKNSRCISMEQICDYTDDCGNFEDERKETCAAALYRCSFDQSLCDWTIQESSTSTWIRREAFESISQGPTRDHTTGTASGKFLLLPGKIRPNPGRILGPLFQPAADCKMRFHYDIRGLGPLYLQVKTRSQINGEEKVVWSRETATDGFFFVDAIVPFAETDNFQVLIEGSIQIAEGKSNYIAIDDVSFNQKCSPLITPLPTAPPTTTTAKPADTCESFEFACNNGLKQCINKTQVCDFVEDCDNGGADETHCGKCDFEVDMCGLVDTTSLGSYKWERHRIDFFVSTKNTTVPEADSSGNAEGYFAVLSPVGGTGYRYSRAAMQTPKLGEMGHSCKLEFWYHYNVRSGKFQISIMTPYQTWQRRILFTTTSMTGRKWQHASIGVGNYPAGKVFEFHGETYRDYFFNQPQDMAIDHINYVNCNPKFARDISLNCTFEEDECGWFPDNANSRVNWQLGKSTGKRYGPTKDRKGKTGFFMYVSGGSYFTGGQSAHLVSLRQPAVLERCFTLWYHMYGQDVGTLNIITKTDAGNQTIWSKSSSQGNVWKKAQRTIRSEMNYSIIIEGITGRSYKSVIAIDDIVVLESSCPTPVGCDFEADLCDWIPTGWILQKAKLTKPAVDHTTGTSSGGYALLAEETGYLMSPSYNYSSNGHCLKFWYFLEGGRDATLSVIKVPDNPDAEKAQPSWKDVAQPNREGQWMHAVTNIDDMDIGEFTISFNGEMKNNSIVALDDIKLADGACPPYGSCNFEEDMCTWRNLQSPYISNLVWLRNSGSTYSYGTGPSNDHTTGTEEGWYVFLDTDDASPGKSAVLESENLHYAPKTCIKFWYHMYGRSVGTLLVSYFNPGDNKITTVNRVSGNQGNQWREYSGLVENMPKTYRIRLTGTVGGWSGGDIAIDDILIQSETCDVPVITTPAPTQFPPTPYDCNFEEGHFCNWDSGSTWVVQDGRRAVVNGEGPHQDHYGSSQGRYAYYHPLGDEMEDMKSPEIDVEANDYCLGFWYYLHSSSPVSLSIFVTQYEQTSGPLWLKNNSAGTEWKYGSFFFEKSVNLTIILRATRPSLGIGDIAIDDIKMNIGRCPVVRGQPCDFESSDICGYKMESPDGITWKRILAQKTIVGPKTDKTYGTNRGHYMIVTPSSTSRVPGDNQALLIVPNVPSTGEESSCLKFWYQMAGSNVESFNVHVRPPGANLPKFSVWSHSTKSGRRWTIGMQEISARYIHEIVFEAVTDRGNDGYIALDDVVIVDGRCPPPGSCDFERDMCTWQNAQSGVDVEWVRNTGPSLINDTGPEVDHTLGTAQGSYAYLQASNPADLRNLVGILESEFFSMSSTRCLSFWAHMYGSKMGTLSVNVSYYDETGEKILHESPWQIEGDQGNKWFKRLFTINTTDTHEEYQIRFIGKTKGNLSDMALDDIEIKNDVCYEVPDTAFDCKDGTHVNKSQVCDFELDCPHGEDEANCGACDFEHSNCGWYDITPNYYQSWQRKQGVENMKSVGPGYDHTFNSSSGFFMVVQTSRYSYQIATLQSPGNENQFKKSYATCIMKFYYYMPNKSESVIRIRKRLGSYTTGSVWERVGSEGDGWKLGIAYLSTTERPFYIDIIQQSSYVLTYTTIDDISFENCSLPEKRDRCNMYTEYRCANQRCIPRDFLCDLTDDCGDGSDESKFTCWYFPKACNFESYGDCEWKSKGKRINWYVQTAYSTRGRLNSGPLVDHTKGLDAAGKYLVLKKSSTSIKYNISYYYSPNYYIPVYSSCDLRFYYYMHGTETAKLKVHAEFEEDGWSWKELWSHQGSLSQSWNRGFASVTVKKPFHFIIEGDLGNDTQSVLAIDDLSLSYGCKNYSGSLPTPEPTELPTVDTLCNSKQFRCRSGKPLCIDISKVCDFTPDCADASDEDNCGNCDFENSMCGWKDNSYGPYQWSRKNGSYPNTEGPTADSKNSSDGYFMYVKRSYGFYGTATLLSPSLPPTSSHCVMSFWYYLDGMNSNDISVEFKLPRGFNSALKRITFRGPFWNYTEVKIPLSSNRGSMVKFVSNPRWNYYEKVRDVAIDDIKFLNCNPNRLLVDCDFDDDNFNKGFCFWTQPTFSGMSWIRGNGTTVKNFTGPSSDHTTGDGFYLYVNPQRTYTTKYATLISPIIPMNDPEGSCFSFWYHMYGNNVGTLSIITKRVSLSYVSWVKWRRVGNQGRRWLHGEVYMLENRDDFKINIEAVSRWLQIGNIAIDDLKLSDGSCPRTTSCDFESGFCGWSTSSEGQSTWIRSQGSGNFSTEKPQRDHTTGTEYGYFIYLPRIRPGDEAKLESPDYVNSGEVCVKFWYFMFGDDIGSLSVYQKTHDETRLDNLKELWQRNGNHGLLWKLGRVTLKSLPRYYITIKGEIGTTNTKEGFIALDDISVIHGACSNPASCNFEIDTCGWTVFEAFMDFDWIRRTGLDQNMGPGPAVDTTTNTAQGHYMYAYVSGEQSNASSMLISEDLEIYPNYCFSMYYNMYNAINASLYLRQMIIGMGWEDILTFDNYDSNIWKYAETNISVEAAGDYFSLGLLAVVKDDLENTTGRGIAVDDIILRKDVCGTEVVTTALPPPTTTPYPHTKFDCDFEAENFCKNFWLNDEEVTGKWIIATGHNNKSTRPRIDHTTGSTKGHYIMLDENAKYYYPGYKKARLISADGLEGGTDGVCFKFWYYMFGNNPGKLFLRLQDFHDEDSYETLLTKSGSAGLFWNYQQIHIMRQYNHKIVIEGQGGQGGDIALDDFSLNFGICPPREFCDVEYDFCGFSNDPEAKIQWLRGAGFNTSGPDVDHTYGTQYGNYFYIDVKKPIETGDTAILESSSYQPQKKCMRFWYYLYGENVGSLEVYTRQGDYWLSQWKEVGDNHTFWRGAEVRLNNLLSLPFTYAFQMKAGQSVSTGSVGLDDIVIKDDCPPPGSCNFEEDMCLWTNNPHSNLQWLRGSGEITDVAPSVDVTFKTQFGIFLYVHVVNSYSFKRTPAELLSPFFSPTKTRCINFWNFRNGTDKPTLILIRHDLIEDYKENLIVLSGEKAGKWVNDQAQIDSMSQYRLIFLANITNKERQFIALDDITVTNEKCSDIATEKPTFTCDGDTHISDDFRCDFYPDCKDLSDESGCGLECDFETEEPSPCNWANSKSDSGSWKQIKASKFSNPDHDHTNMTIGEGHYMRLVSPNTWRYNGFSSEFVSPLLIESSPTCRLFFWYFTQNYYSTDIIEVFYDSPVQSKKLNVFTLSVSNSRVWKLAEAVIGRITHRFRVGIYGKTQYSSSVIAIDDLKFENCPIPRSMDDDNECGKNEYKCKNNNCIPLELVCDFTDDCGDYSDENILLAKCDRFPARCDFEQGFCDWNRAAETDDTWSRISANTRSFYDTIPLSRDHTKNTGDGYFLFSTNRYRSKGRVSRLESPVMQVTDSSCKLRMFYTYSGSFKTVDYATYTNVGSFTIYVRYDKAGAWDPVLTLSAPFGQYFEKASLSFGHIKGPFQVIIESKAGEASEGGWAFDDVSFTLGCVISNESLPNFRDEFLTTKSPDITCDEDKFSCNDGSNCLEMNKVCDFVKQCQDGSDEARCGTCNFDDDSNPTCGWSDVNLNRWVRQKGVQGRAGPDYDVSGSGYYMYASRKNDGTVGSKAVLRSVNFQKASSNCKMNFFYYFTGLENRDAHLKVRMRTSDGHLPFIWEEFTDRGKQWINATADIEHRTKGWSVEFIATHVLSKADIAVDNIEFINCAPIDNRDCQKPTDFPCGAGKCIDKTLVCDFNWDCADGSDEKNCTDYKERCDFENGNLCSWTQNKNTVLEWKLKAGQDIEEGAGPRRDHTVGDETGHFLILSGRNTWYAYSATLFSTSFKGDITGNCLLRFWYHMFSNSTSSLTVNILDAGDTRSAVLQNLNGSTADEWIRAIVPIKNKVMFQAAIVGTTAVSTNGEVAIDDISFTTECIPMYIIVTTPIPTVQPSGKCAADGKFECDDNSCIPMSEVCDFKIDCQHGADEKQCPSFCNFEDGKTCGWNAITSAGDGVEFKVVTAETANNNDSSVPAVDKTTGKSSGRYLLVHQDVEREVGPIDSYRSPNFTAAAITCKLKFWYAARVYKKPIVILNYSQLKFGSVYEKLQVEMFQLSQSTDWVQAEMGLGRRTSNFSISFDKQGMNYRWNYFALDDIEFSDCALPIPRQDTCKEFHCEFNKACINSSKICDLVDDCGDKSDEANCTEYILENFESKLDYFFRPLVRLTEAPITWKLQSGSAAQHVNNKVGPPFDHTYSSESGTYYSFTRGKDGTFKMKGWLASKVLQSKGNCKMRFHYFMYGSDIYVLNVLTRTKDGGNMTQKWSKEKEVGNFWVREEVLLDVTGQFEVIFEGQGGVGPNDFIAIDDVSFTSDCRYMRGVTLPPVIKPGTTPATTPLLPGTCKADEFFCESDNLCISREKVCNFRKDCSDGSDEKNCVKPHCDFQNKDLCGWEVFHKLKNYTRQKREIDEETIFRWIPIQANDEHTKINQAYRPTADHTKNSTKGWYLLADGAPGRQGDITSLASTKISSTHGRCNLDFWIYCAQWDCNLEIFADQFEGDKIKSSKSLWKAESQLVGMRMSKRWKHAKVHLSSMTDYKVRMDATRPYSYQGAICLDDIAFENCPPPIKINNTVTTCGVKEFMCNNDNCIDSDLLCDYNNDCSDNSDETQFRCSSYVARCAFEHGLCSHWHTQDAVSPVNRLVYATWAVKSGSYIFATSPAADHTTRTPQGSYLSVSSTNLKPTVYSDTLSGNEVGCKLRLWYNIVRFGHSLNIYKRYSYNEGDMELQTTLRSDVQDFWHSAQVEFIEKGKDFQIVFIANFSNYIGTVNIDDLSMTPECQLTGKQIPGSPITPPPPDKCGPEKFSCDNGKCYTHLQRCNFINDCGDFTDEKDCGTTCDFEKSTCGWYSPIGYNGKWERKNGSHSYGSPLVSDHTLKNNLGFYMTPIARKFVLAKGDVTHMQTEVYVASGPHCVMTMWYFVTGGLVGNLSVILKSHSESEQNKELWKVIGDQGAEWKQMTADIKTQKLFSIGIHLVHRGSVRSYVAIDDIEFDKCAPDNPAVECVSDEFMCTETPQCIKVWEHCDGKYDCKDKSDESDCISQYGDCSFDSEKWLELCQLTPAGYDFEWSRAVRSHSNKTGPSRNHNERKAGAYLFINSSLHSEGEKAGILTPLFKASENRCHLRFWYFMKGSPGMGKLEVLTQGINSQVNPVWVKSGPQEPKWLYSHVLVGSGQDYNVLFVGYVGSDEFTDIAIDDISFTSGCKDGGTAVVPTGKPDICQKDDFHCVSGKVKCIPFDWRCNCIIDCYDGSDEDGCTNTCASTGVPVTRITSPAPTFTTGTPIPQEHCKKGWKLCSDKSKCIPGLLLCDGIPDCIDKSDETQGCPRNLRCGADFFYCKDRAYPPCIHRDKICDGNDDCSDGSDESLCKECQPGFCINNGSCSTTPKGDPVCKCKEGFAQNRCRNPIVKPEPEEPPVQFGEGSIAWIPGVVIGTLLVAAIGFTIWYKRNTNVERQGIAHAVDNPTYGLSLDNLNFSELSSHHTQQQDAGSTSIENPLYALK